MRKDAARTVFGRRLRCTSYAGMNQIKFAGSESISAQPLRTPGKAECTPISILFRERISLAQHEDRMFIFADPLILETPR